MFAHVDGWAIVAEAKGACRMSVRATARVCLAGFARVMERVFHRFDGRRSKEHQGPGYTTQGG
jgi:hypothetical protein